MKVFNRTVRVGMKRCDLKVQVFSSKNNENQATSCTNVQWVNNVYKLLEKMPANIHY